MNDILLKKQKNVVDTAEHDRYDFATLVKPQSEHSVYSSNYFEKQWFSVHLFIQTIRQMD